MNSTLFVTIFVLTLVELRKSGMEETEGGISSSNVALVFSGKGKLHFIRFKKPTRCVEIFIERHAVKVIQIKMPYVLLCYLVVMHATFKHTLTLWLLSTIIHKRKLS